jgi:hypothetical protein
MLAYKGVVITGFRYVIWLWDAVPASCVCICTRCKTIGAMQASWQASLLNLHLTDAGLAEIADENKIYSNAGSKWLWDGNPSVPRPDITLADYLRVFRCWRGPGIVDLVEWTGEGTCLRACG